VLHAERGGERAGHRREGDGARAGMTKNLKNCGRLDDELERHGT
jgi:hypothetical protein